MYRMFPFHFTQLTLAFPHFFVFFFNDTATTEIYTLSLHDALPIFVAFGLLGYGILEGVEGVGLWMAKRWADRKSTRLNSSHPSISYAVFCLKKKKKKSIRCILHRTHDIPYGVRSLEVQPMDLMPIV